MSIFPKMITRDENVIVHVRIKNYDDNEKFLQLKTYIKAPNGRVVKRFNKDFLLYMNSENKIYKDFYFEFKPSKKSSVGRYVARTDLFYKGEVLHSLTVDNDYFLVEKLNIKKVDFSKNMIFYLENESKEVTNFSIIIKKGNSRKKINYSINGLEERKFEYSKKICDQIYIEYANAHLERILENKDKTIYLRNYKYNWKRDGNELILFNEKEHKKLNNYLAYIWLSCDGNHTVSEIANDCQEKKTKIEKALKKLKRKGLIFLKRKS